MLFHLTPTAPAEGYGEALLPLADAKAWLRLESGDDDEDDLIAALRDAALNMVEQYCGIRLAAQTGLVAQFAAFGPGMRMGIGPAATVTVQSIAYLDAAGTSVSLTSGDWRVAVDGALLPGIGRSWPVASGSVTVTFSAGYPSGAAPAPLISAAKMFLAHLYANREAVVVGTINSELSLGFTSICAPYRMPVI